MAFSVILLPLLLSGVTNSSGVTNFQYESNNLVNVMSWNNVDYEFMETNTSVTVTSNFKFKGSIDYVIDTNTINQVFITDVYFYVTYDNGWCDDYERQTSDFHLGNLNWSFNDFDDFNFIYYFYFDNDNLDIVFTPDNFDTEFNFYASSVYYSFGNYQPTSDCYDYDSEFIEFRFITTNNDDFLINTLTSYSSNNLSSYESGYNKGYENGQFSGYDVGYNDGYNDGFDADSTVFTIFNGILNVGMIPLNFFLGIFNFEILGINLKSLISALLTVSIIIVIIRMVTGKKE